MHTYIALLRGINVSGQKKIKMAELRTQLTELGFENVQTYIQSGNILFHFPETEHEILEKKIADKISADYGFEVPVLVKKATDFQEALDRNPYLKDENNDPKRIYFTFLATAPSVEQIKVLEEKNYEPELYTIDSKNIYLYVPKGYGRTKLSNNLFEQKLKVQATTRNLKTVKKLIELAN